MKKRTKFFLFLIILLAAAGGIFYAGWLQIRLGEHEYGLVFTKINGYDEDFLPPGQFIWRWENLIPTNLKLHVFDLSPRQSTAGLKGELPSGNLFSQYMEGSPDFDYDMSFRLSYRLRPESLLELVKTGELNSDDPDQWYGTFEDRCLLEAGVFLTGSAADPDFYGDGGYNPARMGELLKNRLQEKFPQVEFTAVVPVSLVMPDMALYRRAREEYENLMVVRRALDAQNMEAASRRIQNDQANIGLLEKYGELFTKYPVLLEYLTLNTALNEDILSTLDPPADR